jgi:hypothetical protein
MLINFISFYALWWSVAFLANKNFDIFLVILFLVFIFIHFKFVVKSFKPELKTMIPTLLLGLVFDFSLHFLGFFKFVGNFYFWLPLIWIGFSSTINHSLSKIFNNIYGLFLFSFLGGPATYYGVSRLGLMQYQASIQNFIIHGILWSVFMFVVKRIKNVKSSMS